MNQRQTERLLERVVQLLFGIFGQVLDEQGDRKAEVGGSGFFVAPYLTVTARHVSEHLLRLDGRPHGRPGYFLTEHSAGLVQIQDALRARPRPVFWEVNRAWTTPLTDISLMQVSAEGGTRPEFRPELPGGFLEWAMLPPPVGTEILMVGYPLTAVEVIGDQISVRLQCRSQRARVTDLHWLWRDRGMMSFPCFRVDSAVDHGFSGGPVLWDDRLCGVVSMGPSYDDATYVASLWPFSLMEYEYPEFGGATSVASLLDKGVIRSNDWGVVRERVHRRQHDDGGDYAYLDEPH